MSSVRMCDRCGKIFSEREDDWSTYTATIRRKDENGHVYPETTTLDSCNDCTAGTSVPTPKAAIVASGEMYNYVAARDDE